jgi:transcriptional regulator with XRE-family HTH domain
MTATAELFLPPIANGAADCKRPVTPPGVIGAAVIKAARRSARLTHRRLARAARVTPATVHQWESGTLPLYCVGYRDLRQLAETLASAGAIVGTDVAELMAAGQCDLLLTGMLNGFEDYAEVPPIEEPGPRGDLAREFVRWALTGIVPNRFLGFTARRPLLAPADAAAIRSVAYDLHAGTDGPELATFGATILALAER